MLSMTELLEYALETRVPDALVDRIMQASADWDEEFVRVLDNIAYEFRPDLAVWQVEADEVGRLRQLRLAPRVSRLREFGWQE